MRLIFFSAAFLLGVFVGSRLELPSLPFLVALAPLALSLLFLRRRRSALYLAIVLALALLGLGRGADSVQSPEDASLSRYHGLREVAVRGVIVTYPEPRGALSQFRFNIRAIKADGAWEKASGAALVRTRPSPDLVELREPPYFRYGDSLQLTGQLQEPPRLGDFDWRDHLAREGIHSLMARPQVTFLGANEGAASLGFIYDVRADMARGIARALPEPQASLSHAMLLGLRTTLPSELREDLADTGTTHLIAISGLHVGILVGLVSGLSLRIFGRRRYLYILVPLLFIWVYALLT
ncbi:MAG: ComEC/Rec2 family competence protein, partial [Dehalococcoidia bacterium]